MYVAKYNFLKIFQLIHWLFREKKRKFSLQIPSVNFYFFYESTHCIFLFFNIKNIHDRKKVLNPLLYDEQGV